MAEKQTAAEKDNLFSRYTCKIVVLEFVITFIFSTKSKQKYLYRISSEMTEIKCMLLYFC